MILCSVQSVRGALKRRYLDLRLGGVTINPLIQATNFVMISYIVFQDSVSFWVYAPVFFTGVMLLFAVAGLLFRKIQLSTDEDLKYEKQVELNKTLAEIMKNQKLIGEKLGLEFDKSFNLRLDRINEITKI